MSSSDPLEKFRRVREGLDEVSPSFCLAKWKQVTLHLHNGHTQSCHHVVSHRVDPETLDQPSNLHNTPEKLKSRSQMLQGERPKECDYCWRIEDRGELSDRVYKSSESWAWPQLQEVLREGTGVQTVPSYVEISFDSACQFKCMYCGPAYSTRWQKEIEEHGPYPTSTRFNSFTVLNWQKRMPLSNQDKDVFIQAFWRWWPELAPRLRHLRVTGGEPLLSPETFKLMDRLIAEPQKQLIFSINTNMGFGRAQGEAFLARLKKLQASVEKVTVFTSLDSVGEQAEYIRYGLQEEQFKNNVKAVLEGCEPGLMLCFMVTVNSLCLPGLPKLMAYLLELRRQYPQHEFVVDTPYLRYPRHLSVELLPTSFVRYIDETVDFMSRHPKTSTQAGFQAFEIQKVSRIRELMEKSGYGALEKIILKRDFYKMFREYDRRRGVDFLKTFPEYQEFWEDCSRYAII